MSNISIITSTPLRSNAPSQNTGFNKVVAGGRIVLLDPDKPHLERMVTGSDLSNVTKAEDKQRAVLESVISNLIAGIQLVDKQETELAKIGGKLSDIALYLNRARRPNSSSQEWALEQINCLKSQQKAKQISLKTHDGSALFCDGPSKPVTIAVPCLGEWEGLSIDRADLGQPGIKTTLNGKIHGDGPGFFLDPGSIQRAFEEWRLLCIYNRLSSGMLLDRLHSLKKIYTKSENGRLWNMPDFPIDNSFGPLRRPHRNN